MAEKRPLPELKAYREQRELSVKGLADELGVSAAAISRWETGERRPHKKYVPIISELTGVPPLELMGVAE